MINNRVYIDSFNEGDKKNFEKKISLETTILEFIEIVGWKHSSVKKGTLPAGVYFSLGKIGYYVDNIGKLKELAEKAGGFSRLKHGVYFDNGKVLPYTALESFGKKKLECLNNILTKYEIEPISWLIKRYRPWEMKKEKGEDWRDHL